MLLPLLVSCNLESTFVFNVLAENLASGRHLVKKYLFWTRFFAIRKNILSFPATHFTDLDEKQQRRLFVRFFNDFYRLRVIKHVHVEVTAIVHSMFLDFSRKRVTYEYVRSTGLHC